MISSFLHLCEELGIPVSMEKTEWALELIVFLGVLLDRRRLMLALPEEKWTRAINLLKEFADPSKTKVTVKQLQQLCGFLISSVMQSSLAEHLPEECMQSTVIL